MSEKPKNLSAFYKSLLDNGSFIGSDEEGDFFINNLTDGTPFAYSRFNDGEMTGICMQAGLAVARGDQVVNLALKEALTEAISHKQKNYFIGLTCPRCQPYGFYEAGKYLTKGHDHIVRAVATTNRNWGKITASISKACDNRRIRYISGEDQDLSFLKNEMGLNIIDQVKLPRVDSWSSIADIEGYIDNVNDEDVVMISLGPTARILAQRWFKEKPTATFLDVGSNFDPFTRNVWHKCHLGWESGFNVQNKCEGCN